MSGKGRSGGASYFCSRSRYDSAIVIEAPPALAQRLLGGLAGRRPIQERNTPGDQHLREVRRHRFPELLTAPGPERHRHLAVPPLLAILDQLVVMDIRHVALPSPLGTGPTVPTEPAAQSEVRAPDGGMVAEWPREPVEQRRGAVGLVAGSAVVVDDVHRGFLGGRAGAVDARVRRPQLGVT